MNPRTIQKWNRELSGTPVDGWRLEFAGADYAMAVPERGFCGPMDTMPMDTMQDPVAGAPRRRWPAAVAVAIALAVLAAGTWRWNETRLQGRARAIAAYDVNMAMELAGAQVPATVESFYFFVLEADASGETEELAQKLVQAAGERDFVGITGADADHNRDVLRAALASAAAQDLRGLVIIYVGPADHEAELASLVRATGAQMRFVTYRPALETI
jgi:hypothetical protein